jgi:putative tryptophan/tyrosine transport system substrate-binding protein
MKDLGYVEGNDFVIEWRSADWKFERLRELAVELVKLKVDVIVATTRGAVEAAQQATTTIPIVMTVSHDPVGMGLVSSLARPGGNTTGVSSANDETLVKQLDLLNLIIPNLSRVGFMVNQTSLQQQDPYNLLSRAAQKFSIALQRVDVIVPADIETAFVTMNEERVQVLILNSSPLFNNWQNKIAELAFRYKLPSITQRREYAVAGGLLSYGESGLQFYRRAAYFVDKILKGAKPGDLPVELPTKFELVINLKTAKALGLTVPPLLLSIADEVIE